MPNEREPRGDAAPARPDSLGEVCGVVLRARTATQGVFDVVIGERGLVLVPLYKPFSNAAAAIVLGGFQGGVVGHKRGAAADERRKERYFAEGIDVLARHYFSNRTVRRQDVVRVQVKEHHGAGRLRLELTDGSKYVFRWEKRANGDRNVGGLLTDALGRAGERHAA
jgi:hypothetical protein